MTGTFLFTKWFAWATHKHIMHGWGWRWHRSHHEPRGTLLWRNNLYALTFASFVILLFLAGTQWQVAKWSAVGITLYGAVYLSVHDMMVHQRLGIQWVPRRGYAKRLLQAHRLHHAVSTREGGVSFGFLFVSSPSRLTRMLADRVLT